MASVRNGKGVFFTVMKNVCMLSVSALVPEGASRQSARPFLAGPGLMVYDKNQRGITNGYKCCMSSRTISDPKLFFASMQAQFDLATKQKKINAYQTKRFSKQQAQTDHELDLLMGDNSSGRLIQKHPSRLAVRKKEAGAPADKRSSPISHLATGARRTAHVSSDSAPSYFNALAAVFAVVFLVMLTASWYFWPTSHWNWPYVPPEVRQVDMTEPVDAANAAAAVAGIDIAAAAAVVNVSTAETEKRNPLNAILAVHPTGAGHQDASVQQHQPVDTILKIIPPVGLIRSEPGRQSDVVARLEQGSLVVGLGRQGDWLRVRLPDNREAWAYKTIVAAMINEQDRSAQIPDK